MLPSNPNHESPGVLPLPWDKFLPWFEKQWKPGEHVALIGPTGVGKSTFAVGILPSRKWVMALDPKGGDTTLSTLETSGFTRIVHWPPSRRWYSKERKIWQGIERGEAARLIVGPRVKTKEDLAKLRKVIGEALDGAFDTGGWTVYLDELQIAADSRMMALSGSIERILIAARDKKVSLITSYQRPANVPRAASEMSTWLAIWYTRDTDTVNRLGEMTGRPKAEIRGAVRGLGIEDNYILLFSRNPRLPIVVTKAPQAGVSSHAKP